MSNGSKKMFLQAPSNWRERLPEGWFDIEDMATLSPTRKAVFKESTENEVQYLPTHSPTSTRSGSLFSSGIAAANRLDALMERENWDSRDTNEIVAAATSCNKHSVEEDVNMLRQFDLVRIQRKSFLSKNLERFLRIEVPGPEKTYAEYDKWVLNTTRNGTCVSCRITHGPPEGIVKVVIGDSTLRGALARLSEVSTNGHIHWINVSGLKIEEAFALFLQWMGTCDRPVHLLLLIGINNILQGHSLRRMKRDFANGRLAIEEMDSLMGREGQRKTKVTYATIPMPPRALGIGDDGVFNHRDSGLTPMGRVFQNLNDYLIGVNRDWNESGDSPPRFHGTGIKSKMVRGRRCYQVRWKIYREERISKKLHLNLDVRASMITKIKNWFRGLYPDADQENNDILDRSFDEYSFEGE